METNFRKWWPIPASILLMGLAVPHETQPEKKMTADEVLESESVIEGLRIPLAALSKSVLNLELPDAQSRHVFEANVRVRDLGAHAPDEPTQFLAHR